MIDLWEDNWELHDNFNIMCHKILPHMVKIIENVLQKFPVINTVWNQTAGALHKQTVTMVQLVFCLAITQHAKIAKFQFLSELSFAVSSV